MATMARTISPSEERLPASNAELWHAVETRDARFDERVVYAVRSTGVYCRPSCASRLPRRENVSFFATPDAAEAAGYRACRRCTPKSDRGSDASRVVAAARAYLDANVDRAVTLDELSKHVGMSASHLQRVFTRIVGLSPRQYQSSARLDRFKSRLRAGDTVSRATYEAGFGSSSRVYEHADSALGMTPAAYRRGGAGVQVTYTIAETPLGRVLVATTDRGVCAVELGSSDTEVVRALEKDFPNAEIRRDDNARQTWVRAVVDRVRRPGGRAKNRIPLDAHGSAFQMKVWEALERIPAGERRTYREVAESLGRPSASRAVARACATNKIAVIVPCHRVVRGDGGLAGYKWGMSRKRRLLEEEK